ncbi:signal peptidase II [Peptostreptococcus russellii]|uniref:signal peptidase II n=1 Tax=Peptostreptococcus russellii TaxID=215200 RepID=UPI0027D93A2D|nr:signal peptidase II [uncultured Peptostreptococcus sp.]
MEKENLMYLVLIIILIALDQFSKIAVQQMLSGRSSLPIINGIFHLTYVENRGAAFGLMQGKQIIFAIVAAVVTVVGLVCIYKKTYGKLVNISISLVIAGAIGNLIDRIKLGYVVDFLDFRFIWNYVFNLADVFVIVGTLTLCISIIISDLKEGKKEKNNKKRV